MEAIVNQIDLLKKDIQNAQLDSPDAVENFRIKYLGAKSVLKQLMGQMKTVPQEQRKLMGELLNNLKQTAEEKYQTAKDNTAQHTSHHQSHIDYSLPGKPIDSGSLHPITIIHDKIVEIFSHIGFSVADGPEIEDDWHNFTALNLHEHHPARDMQDTFYVHQNPDWVLRTHTSSVQVRTMESDPLPIRKIFPGRVYRNETISARAHCFFHQVEGLYIAHQVSFADLKQTLYYFCTEMFGADTQLRFRPSYFPFTEPSAELDVSCFICHGTGCSVCKHTGWVEILGCGMVHPQVLTNSGIDPEQYSGFAFGMGIERITMLKFGINDLRLFSENDTRFLDQFVGLQL